MTLTNNEAVTGTVCPGEIMLHAIDTPLDGSASQLHWDVTMFAGDVYIMMALDHPQLRLVNPPPPTPPPHPQRTLLHAEHGIPADRAQPPSHASMAFFQK